MKIDIVTTEAENRPTPIFKSPHSGTPVFVVRIAFEKYAFCYFKSNREYHLDWWDDRTFTEGEIMKAAREQGLLPFYGKAVITVYGE